MNKILVMSIGNDIMGDDGAAFEAAKLIQKRFPDEVDYENVYGGGMEILDYLEGKEKVLILDTISEGNKPAGSITEIEREDFPVILTSSPHYIGLPEVLRLAEMFEIEFPAVVKILAIHTELQYEVTEDLSEPIKSALPEYAERAIQIIEEWMH
ncbi:MAG: hydrogenase maturation protease [Ignavibacteriae bacterium]|nr:hydrogenase maturation protease [Ignavibacteriota bacterium]